MLKYTFENVNPKGHITSDCTTRALTSTLGISYEEALKLQYEIAVETGYAFTDKHLIEKILAKYHYKKMKQPKKEDGKLYRVKELDKLLTEKQLAKGVFVVVNRHHICVKDTNIIDTWNSSNEAVRNYYVKEF